MAIKREKDTKKVDDLKKNLKKLMPKYRRYSRTVITETRYIRRIQHDVRAFIK